MVRMIEPPAEPAMTNADPFGLLVEYLDFYHEAVLRKFDGMPETEARRSRLPSGWSPIELLKHLIHMEWRWTEWRFLGTPAENPWPENGPDGNWQVPAEESLDSLLAELRTRWARTREIIAATPPEEIAASGGGFGPEDQRPTLVWTLFHMLQEYVRHVGHLDIARELSDETIGE